MTCNPDNSVPGFAQLQPDLFATSAEELADCTACRL